MLNYGILNYGILNYGILLYDIVIILYHGRRLYLAKKYCVRDLIYDVAVVAIFIFL